MSSGNQQLGFAIRAVNEATAELSRVAQDLGAVEKAAVEADGASKELNSTWDRLQQGVDELGNSMDTLSEKIDPIANGLEATAEAAGNLERVLIGTKDIMGVLEEQFGVNLGPMTEYAQAAADVAGGLEGVIAGGTALAKQLGPLAGQLAPVIAATWAHVTALGAQAVAFVLANAPILLLIAGIAALAAGVVLLIKHWDDIEPHLKPVTDFFNNEVVPAARAVWEEGLKPVVDFVANNWQTIATLIAAPFLPLILVARGLWGVKDEIIGGIQDVVGAIETGAGWIGHWLNVAGGYFEDFKKMVMGPINAVIGALTTLVDLAGKAAGALGMGSGSFNTGAASSFNSSVEELSGIPSGMLSGGGGGGASTPATPTGAYGNPLTWMNGYWAEVNAGSYNPSMAGGGVYYGLGGGPGGATVVNNITVQGSVWSLDELAYELQHKGVVA